MFNFFKKDKWGLVKIIKHAHPRASYIYHIHLYESDKGNRRATFSCEGEKYDIDRKDGYLKATDLYQMKIRRWLDGRMDPDIPRYDQISEEDTANFLKGTI